MKNRPAFRITEESPNRPASFPVINYQPSQRLPYPFMNTQRNDALRTLTRSVLQLSQNISAVRSRDIRGDVNVVDSLTICNPMNASTLHAFAFALQY